MAGIALVTLHGMGKTETGYEVPLLVELRRTLPLSVWDRLTIAPVHYQDVFQPNEDKVYDAMVASHPLRWTALRTFLLYGFSDAAGLLYAKNAPGSAYEQVQRRLFDALRKAYQKVGPDGQVVVLAQSLGAEVVSNYLWDADPARTASVGIWKDPAALGLDSDEERFCRLRSLRHLVTTGCNIPVFISSLNEPTAFNKPSDGFRWLNYFDKDDPLGWPLGPLGPTYADLVEDIEINAGTGFLGLLESATPISHMAYWTDDDIIAAMNVLLTQVATTS